MRTWTRQIRPQQWALIWIGWLLCCGLAQAAPGGGSGGTHPAPMINRCGGQLLRAPDAVITMAAGTAFYKTTESTAPTTTLPIIDSGTMTAAEAKLKACKRRVIEIRVPATASSGCATCSTSAEIHVCAGSFTGSKTFEEHCKVPTSSTSSTNCKTFNHAVEVFKKPSGQTKFTATVPGTFVYKGFIDNTGCRVAAKYLGQLHDTAEVYANVAPPASGTDVYRALTLPNFKWSLLDTVLFIEFEKR